MSGKAQSAQGEPTAPNGRSRANLIWRGSSKMSRAAHRCGWVFVGAQATPLCRFKSYPLHQRLQKSQIVFLLLSFLPSFGRGFLLRAFFLFADWEKKFEKIEKKWEKALDKSINLWYNITVRKRGTNYDTRSYEHHHGRGSHFHPRQHPQAQN